MRKILVWLGIVFVGLVSVTWPVSVTVSKPGGGGTYATVQEGINAAGANGTVTILDSQTYIEDVTIASAQAGVMVTAAAGQRPTIQAVNGVNRPVYAGIGIVSPSDHFGISVQGSCTLEGLNISNLDPTCNTHATLGVLSAAAVIIHVPGVTVRDCHIFGPGAGFGAGDWTACLVVAFSPIPAAAQLENCEIYGAEYGVVDETFSNAMPTWADSFLTLTACDIHNNTAAGLTVDAGVTTVTRCLIHDNPGTGVSGGGGKTVLVGCDILNNNTGMSLSWNSDFARQNDWPNVTARDCMIFHNGTTNRNIQIDDGLLTLDHSIISQGGRGGILLQHDNPADAILDMNFCDIFAPGQTCVEFEGPGAKQAFASIRNSILYGNNGVLCDPAHRAGVGFSSVFVTGGTAFQNTVTSNTVAIEPRYINSSSSVRGDFCYLNDDLNVGEGGAQIGSQGRYQPTDVRRWMGYD